MEAAAVTPLLTCQKSKTTVYDATSDIGRVSHDDYGPQRRIRSTRSLKLFNGIAIVLGVQIGSGIFVSPSLVARNAGSVAAALLMWVIGGLITWTCAASYIELGVRLPFNGGAQEYLAFCFGKRVAFTASWAIVFVVKPCSSAILALVIAAYLCDSFAIGRGPFDLLSKLIAILTMAAVTAVNCAGNKLTFGVTNGLLACKMVGLGFVILMGLVTAIRHLQLSLPFLASSKISVNPNLGLSLYTDGILSALWAYSGWETVSYVAGEVRNPKRNISRMTTFSTIIVILLFLLANVAYFVILPFNDIISSTSIGLTFSLNFFPHTGALLYVIVICLSSLGSLNIQAFSAGRLTQAAADRGFLPAIIRTVSANEGQGKQSLSGRPSLWNRLRQPCCFRDGSIPMSAIIFNAFLAILYIMLGDLSLLVIFIGLVEFSVAFFTILGLLRLRLYPRVFSQIRCQRQQQHVPPITPDPDLSITRNTEPTLHNWPQKQKLKDEDGDVDDERIRPTYQQPHEGEGDAVKEQEIEEGQGIEEEDDEEQSENQEHRAPILVILTALAGTGFVVSVSAVRHPLQSIGFIVFSLLSAGVVYPCVIRRTRRDDRGGEGGEGEGESGQGEEAVINSVR